LTETKTRIKNKKDYDAFAQTARKAVSESDAGKAQEITTRPWRSMPRDRVWTA